MIDYFELYETILRVIKDKNPSQNDEFLSYMNEEELIKKSLISGVDNKLLVRATFETADNLIDDGLIKGTKTQSKEGKHFIFEGLTTSGHMYLLSLEKPEFKEKAKKILKEEGFPVTPQSISKVITNLII